MVTGIEFALVRCNDFQQSSANVGRGEKVIDSVTVSTTVEVVKRADTIVSGDEFDIRGTFEELKFRPVWLRVEVTKQ